MSVEVLVIAYEIIGNWMEGKDLSDLVFSSGITVHHYKCGMHPPLADGVWVFWFGDNRVSQV